MSGEYWICETCGTKNSVEDTYCKKCGRKITRKELADALNRIERGESEPVRPTVKRTPQRETVRQTNSSRKHQIFDDDSTFVVPREAVNQRENRQRKVAPKKVKATPKRETITREEVRREAMRRESVEKVRETKRPVEQNENIQEKKSIFIPETHKQSKIVKYVPRLIYRISVLVMAICFIVYLVSGTKLGTRVTFWGFLSTLGSNFSKLFQVIYGNIIKMFGGI